MIHLQVKSKIYKKSLFRTTAEKAEQNSVIRIFETPLLGRQVKKPLCLTTPAVSGQLI
jgi:hypothetical protein